VEIHQFTKKTEAESNGIQCAADVVLKDKFSYLKYL